jgi:hypothetical protein
MRVELILPSELSLRDLADRLAGAVMDLLSSDRREAGAYEGAQASVSDAILDYLTQFRISEQSLGAIRSVMLAGGDAGTDDRLEVGLTRAIAGRLGVLFDDLRAVRLVTRELPDALWRVLQFYEWVEPMPEAGPLTSGL